MKLKLSTAALLFFCIQVISVNAQVEDGRLWTGLTLKHKFSRRLTANITEQFRFDHNVSEVDQVFSEAGIEYEFIKNFKASINYRFINKNEFTYYSKAHRIFIDVSYKLKTSLLSFTLRERIQQQYTSINSSETGKIPEWILRSKFTITYNTQKHYKPYTSVEFFNLIDNAKERGEGLNVMRYSVGIDYEFNRIHSLDLSMIYQDDLYKHVQDLIGSIGYTYTF